MHGNDLKLMPVISFCKCVLMRVSHYLLTPLSKQRQLGYELIHLRRQIGGFDILFHKVQETSTRVVSSVTV